MIPEDNVLIEEFLASRNLTARSREDYAYTLSLFADHLEGKGGLLAAEPADFDDWAGRLAASTYNCYLGIVRPFFKWCLVEGYCDALPILTMRNRPKAAAWRRRKLTDDEAEEAISSLTSTRDVAICRLALQCGLTPTQIELLDVGALVSGPDGPVLSCAPRKGASGRALAIALDSASAFVVAAQVRARTEQGAAAGDPMFASLSPRNRGGRLTQRSILRVVSSALSSIGLTSRDVEASFGARTRGGRRRCLVPCPSCAALNGRCPLE
ncbi:hypothetical protein [Olsenella sp. HMSC062G07]|uniref:tyrosine-type recombinase/integrase n=1 Tax=Olsenella sp. HMSC062G07 TaxID=1739330 RepID=UPI0008A11D23|nr:hypothetical protein [Olsenella sp. HMSC062G07]OFK23022.1 hypothetical protein HMPREF2826_00065 [Olsenella sp. HMSC062G07]